MPTQPTRLMTLHALTFLHPGTGQTTGVVDLPVQREVHTGFPMIASSGLKGALRERAEGEWDRASEKVYSIFGPKESDAAGALAITDARILALPVRSLQKVFVWVTCPMVIGRLQRDLNLAGIVLQAGNPLQNVDLSGPAQQTISDDQALIPTDTLTGSLLLEELKFSVTQNNTQADSAAKAITALVHKEDGFDNKRFALISNENFSYLARHATQVSARIALNEKKTTTGDGGNLWYEETLPPETLLYALLLANKPRYKLNDNPPPSIATEQQVITEVDTLLNKQCLQVGGNETVGQGWCSVKLTSAPAPTPPEGTPS